MDGTTSFVHSNSQHRTKISQSIYLSTHTCSLPTYVHISVQNYGQAGLARDFSTDATTKSCLSVFTQLHWSIDTDEYVGRSKKEV